MTQHKFHTADERTFVLAAYDRMIDSYALLVTTVCADCDGTGVTNHEKWRERMAELPDSVAVLTAAEHADPCKTCDGEGRITLYDNDYDQELAFFHNHVMSFSMLVYRVGTLVTKSPEFMMASLFIDRQTQCEPYVKTYDPVGQLREGPIHRYGNWRP